MARMVHISEAASIALHAAVLLAAKPVEKLPAREIAQRLHVSEAHLAKVLQRLAKAGLVRGARGPNGGFTLARDPAAISLLEVYEAIEGKFSPTPCLFPARICRGDKCILGDLLEKVEEQARDYLAGTSLARLTDVYKDKRKGKR